MSTRFHSPRVAVSGESATIAIAGQLSSPIPLENVNGGMVYLDAEFTGDTINWHVSDSRAGTYSVAYSGATAVQSFAAAVGWVAIPDEIIKKAHWLKIHTSVGVAAAATIPYMLKST